MKFLDFFKESTDASSKRLVLIVAGLTMSLAILILVGLSYYNTRDFSNELWALTIPLSGLAGVSYAAVERMRLAKKSSDDKLTNAEEPLEK